jgi:DNA repair protein RadC
MRETSRERLFELGPGALAAGELLALLLGTGIAGHSARAIAERLLLLGPGLKELSRREARELTAVPGVGPARAARLAAAFELGRRVQRSEERRPRLRTPGEIYRYLAPQLSSLRKEVFHVLSLNSRNVLLNDSKVAEGTMNACPVDPREVFSAALGARASAIVLAHNHPSGDPEPSEMDVTLSAQLVEGGRILGIRVLDHIVVGDAGFVSLFERGKLAGCSEGRSVFHARGPR